MLKQCPYCLESIHEHASVCPYCATKQPVELAWVWYVVGSIPLVILAIFMIFPDFFGWILRVN